MTIDRKELESGKVDLSDIVDVEASPITPTPPGELLREEFLDPMAVTPYRLAKDIGVPLTRIMEILANKRAITAETALRFGRYFGTTAEFWLRLQAQYELDVARLERGRDVIEEVRPRMRITVYNFKVWDQIRGEHVITPMKSPADRIEQIGGEILSETAEDVDPSALDKHGRYNPPRSKRKPQPA
jgi:addiction module HigA family antidote